MKWYLPWLWSSQELRGDTSPQTWSIYSDWELVWLGCENAFPGMSWPIWSFPWVSKHLSLAYCSGCSIKWTQANGGAIARPPSGPLPSSHSIADRNGPNTRAEHRTQARMAQNAERAAPHWLHSARENSRKTCPYSTPINSHSRRAWSHRLPTKEGRWNPRCRPPDHGAKRYQGNCKQASA